jgi:hypothetical protein
VSRTNQVRLRKVLLPHRVRTDPGARVFICAASVVSHKYLAMLKGGSSSPLLHAMSARHANELAKGVGEASD